MGIRRIKMKGISKFITVLLTLALMLGAMAVFSTAEAKPILDKANVVYGDQLTIAFTVNNNGIEGEAGIAIFESANAETPIMSTFTASGETNGIKYFESYPIAAKDYEKDIYVAAAVKKADGKVVYGTPTAYSIAEYLNNRLQNDVLTGDQENLYNKILDYCQAVKNVLNPPAADGN